MKVIDYGTVTATKNTPLCDGVQALITIGWQPYGNPYLDRNGVEKQAVVKYEEEPFKIGPVKAGEEVEPIFVKMTEQGPAVEFPHPETIEEIRDKKAKLPADEKQWVNDKAGQALDKADKQVKAKPKKKERPGHE